jgi:hypothetical protein
MMRWNGSAISSVMQRRRWAATAVFGLKNPPFGFSRGAGRIAVAALLLAVWLPGADPWAELTALSAKPAAEAEPGLEELLRRNPGFHAARFNLGTQLLPKDATKAAEQLQLATAATDPALAADAWHNLALARWKQGRLEEALAAADSAAKGNPDYRALRDELRRVAVVRADAARRQAEEEAKRLAFANNAMPEARVGEPYRAAVPVRGGAPPYAVALDQPPAAGTTVTLDPANPAPAPPSPIPPGLALAVDGTLSGTPTTPGSYRLPLTVSDGAQATAKGQVTVVVLPQPAITTAALPEAIIGLPYAATLDAVGMTQPRWTATGLPPGLTLVAGRVSGTPTALGTYPVTVAAEQPVVPPLTPRRAERVLELAVTDSFAPDAPPPPATAGAAYEHRLGVRGPAQAYRWSAPPGLLEVEADGRLHGTPEAEGTVSRPATIQAADGRSRDVALTIPVNPRPLIAVEGPVRLQAGSPVDQALAHTGGTPPFVWKTGEGSLPAGLRLDPDGHVRGVAKDPGSTTITVQLEDRWKAKTQASVTVQVDPASKPQDDAKDQQDQAKQDQQQGEQKPGDKSDAGQQDPSKSDQAQHNQPKPTEPQPAAQQTPAERSAADKQQAAAAEAKKEQERQEREQAAALNQMAADRWLDQLPAEDRGVLRYQLLDGGEKKPDPKHQGKTW